MASLFSSRPHLPRARAVSNGGLGGLVPIDHGKSAENREDANTTWPKSRKKFRPPPINIIQESDKIFVDTATLSPRLVEQHSPRTPRTPRTPMSRFNPVLRPIMTPGSVCVYSCVPEPPASPKQPILPPALALELPGSLLLPSQGFPQSDPPCTPLRQPLFFRNNSDDSGQFGSTPELSVSSSADSEDYEMPKIFPTRHLPRTAKPAKSTASSASAVQDAPTGKPFSAMNPDELLKCLPNCDLEVIKHLWLPAMIKEYGKVKNILQDISEINLDAHNELRSFGADLKAISEDARRISNTYEKAIESAESLVERDSESRLRKLEVTETNLVAAITAVNAKHQAISEKEDLVKQLQHTLGDVIRTLGAFIEEHIPNSLQNIDHEQVQAVMQIIADYSNPCEPRHGNNQRFLRVPEDSYMANLVALRETQVKAEKFRELAISQNNIVNQQSAELDDGVVQYEQCVKTIKERDHEVLLLVERNDQLQKIVEEFEAGFRVSDSTKIVQDRLFKEYEDMECTIKSMKAGHAKQLEERDAEIVNLRAKLGSAREEVLARKADVKNVITHTQALLSPTEPSEAMPLGGLTPKERKMLAKDRDKAKRANLPASRSMLHLGTSPSKTNIAMHELAGDDNARTADTFNDSDGNQRRRIFPRDEKAQWACGMAQKRSIPDLQRVGADFSPAIAPRPRTDSLNHGLAPGDRAIATAIVGNMLGTPIKFQKKLPSPPVSQYAIDIYGGNNPKNNTTTTIEGEDDSERLAQPPHIPDPVQLESQPQAQRKRVLSQIAEMSVEDTESDKAASANGSATSSAKDEYRKSMTASRMIDFLQESDMRSNPAQTTTMAMATATAAAAAPILTYDDCVYDYDHDYEGRGYACSPRSPAYDAIETGVATVVDVGSSPRPQPAGAMDKADAERRASLRRVAGFCTEGDPWLRGSSSSASPKWEPRIKEV